MVRAVLVIYCFLHHLLLVCYQVNLTSTLSFHLAAWIITNLTASRKWNANIKICSIFNIPLLHTKFARFVILLCMTFANFNFPIYISMHLFLHKNYGLHFLVCFQRKKCTHIRFVWRTHMHTHTHTHTHTRTHTIYASNNLSEFHRLLPGNLTFEILQ